MTTEDAPTAEATVLDGRYVLGDLLGRGGMAEVFQARDTTLDRDVAVKLFHQHSALPDRDLRRTGEVRLLARLSHPGLVTLFDAGRDTTDPADPFAYLVMELVEGTTLAEAVSSGRIPRAELADIAEQLAAALVYVHERGVVHRDIKPANVLLRGPDSNGRTTAKLTDFGVARLVGSTPLTEHGTTLGTANYLSPEQATGAPVTSASDIYSLGLVLIEGLTGQIAYPGHGVEAAVIRLHRAPAIPSWVDDGWRALLSDMTAFEPSQRPDAEAVTRRLRALRRDTAPTAVLARHATADGRSTRRPLWLAFALAVLAAIVAVVLGLAGDTDTSTGTPLPNYPAVAGALGTHLGALQEAVPADLRDDVLAVTKAAAAGKPALATAALDRLSADLTALQRSAGFSTIRYQQVAAAIALVARDLSQATAARSSAAQLRALSASRSASKAAASRSAASRSAAASRSTQPPVLPAPPGHQDKGPKPGKGPGHGKGHGN